LLRSRLAAVSRGVDAHDRERCVQHVGVGIPGFNLSAEEIKRVRTCTIRTIVVREARTRHCRADRLEVRIVGSVIVDELQKAL
jgi:hypothetical protein